MNKRGTPLSQTPSSVLEDWRATFRASSGVNRPIPTVTFGDSAEATDREAVDRIGALVACGSVSATTQLLAEYQISGRPLPRVDDHAVVTDSMGMPLCIIRVTNVEIRRLEEVATSHAEAEAEDGTLQGWRAAHRARLASRCQLLGVHFGPGLLLVCTRFECVWSSASGPP